MSVVNSLPDRPLNRTEVDSLSESDSLRGCFPVYGDRPQNRDTAFGVVLILPSGAGKALAYLGDEWQVVDEDLFDYEGHHSESGVPWSEREKMQSLQDSIEQRIGE